MNDPAWLEAVRALASARASDDVDATRAALSTLRSIVVRAQMSSEAASRLLETDALGPILGEVRSSRAPTVCEDCLQLFAELAVRGGAHAMTLLIHEMARADDGGVVTFNASVVCLAAGTVVDAQTLAHALHELGAHRPRRAAAHAQWWLMCVEHVARRLIALRETATLASVLAIVSDLIRISRDDLPPSVLIAALDCVSLVSATPSGAEQGCACDTDAAEMILAAAEELAEDSEARVRVKVALVLQGMTIRGWFGQDARSRIAQLAMTRLSDPCSHARAAFLRVLGSTSSSAILALGSPATPTARHAAALRHRLLQYAADSAPRLAPTHVKRFLEYVLSTANCAGARPPVSWLPDVFDGYGRQLAVARGPMAPNARVVGVWAAWECARACVCARLRTHLGGPAQTFAAFERSLVGGATSSIRGETGLGERQQALVSMLVFLDALEQHIYSASSGCFRSAVAMDDSGMLAVNSSSASAFRLPPPSQSAELFFRTNQKVCEEWLARIRPRALSASVVCGATMDTVRHGLLRANDVSRQLLRLPASAAPTDARRVLRDFDACMAPLLSALAKLRESDTILGLITWYTSVLGRSQHASHLSAAKDDHWKQALLFMSHGAYERALVECESVLSPAFRAADDVSRGHAKPAEVVNAILSACRSSATLELLIEQTTTCHSALGAWAELESWAARLALLHRMCERAAAERQEGEEAAVASREEEQVPGWLVSALAKRADVDRLQLWAQCDAPCGAQQTLTDTERAKKMLEARPHDTEAALHTSEMVLCEVLLSLRASAKQSGVHDKWPPPALEAAARTRLQRATELLAEPLAITSADASLFNTRPITLGPLLTQLTALQLAMSSLEALVSAGARSKMDVLDSRLDTHAHDVGGWNKLLLVERVLSEIRSAVIPACDVGSESAIKRPLVKLARKQGNLTFSRSLLFQEQADDGSDPFVMYESAQLMMADGHSRPALDKLRTMASVLAVRACPRGEQCVMLDHLRSSVSGRGADAHAPQRADSYWLLRALLRLADWLQRESVAPVVNDLWWYADLANSRFRDVPHQVSGSELVVGHCLEAATAIAPDVPKAWLRYAAWLYRQATKASVGGSKEDTSLVVQNEETQFALAGVHAYVEFLRLSSDQNAESRSVAALRILRTLIKVGPQLSDALSAELTRTPVAPWTAILPQLLARMGHPHPFVSEKIVFLVSRVAEVAPHLLVHAAVVGVRRVASSTPEGQSAPATPEEQSAPSTPEGQSAPASGLSATLTGFGAIHRALVIKCPELVSEAEVLIDELNRLAFLWDEQWLALLQVGCAARSRLARR